MDIITLLIALLVYGLGLVVLYFVIRAAVRGGLSDHYKTVRAFEATGEWHAGNHGNSAPRDLSKAQEA